ncbi:putative serine/threonine-protein kinase drkA [Phytophthora citrophthora]|uniref:Serine/threonine-protein kinase drkA n=1 Tax=Phytophthora citrophthora TaxID=4793 RepID=A0AAD9GWR5_9STRA|nr:putative serine/threonine-protein kinase drkA [Phytophthora citrophthora]
MHVRVVLLTLLAVTIPTEASTLMQATVVYSDTNCRGTPIYLELREEVNCTIEKPKCTAYGEDVGTQYESISCVDMERHDFVAEIFGEFSYVMTDLYDDKSCSKWIFSDAYLVAGICMPATTGNTSISSIVRLGPDGSAAIELFDDTHCGVNRRVLFLTSDEFSSHKFCDNSVIFYSSASFNASSTLNSSRSTDGSISATTEASTDSTGLSLAGIVGIVVGSIALALLVVALVVWRRRSKSKQWISTEIESPIDHQRDDSKLNPSYMSDTTERCTMAEVHGYREDSRVTGVWDDEVIVAVRIPRSKVVVHELISRDGYAEVFKGTFNGQLVSVKSLLPETRKNIECVMDFCSEAKMMTTMDHPRIAQLIGVAWDSRTDVCVVSEYLDGGDLRGLLDSFAQLNHPVGFDYDKVKIALHIAHALTYLHSLEPPVIHRNLKSKNVLLTYELDAKVTDFGISREQMDSTMTAGVGSALWMAPEVIMGHRYDEKADVFSFGVVLSELDVHSLPYSHIEAQSNSRHKIPESLILQRMIAGNLQVGFSQRGSGSTQELGKACVAVDPAHRPTAAEVLYKLHTILSSEM